MAKAVKLVGRGRAALGFVVCLQAMAWGCGSHIASAPEPPVSPPATAVAPAQTASSDCAVIAEPGNPIATVALNERVDPSNAPHPSNESERLLFRQLYETLVELDCHGRVSPGLAASWRRDTNGQTWIVTLRENARFSDGAPVMAADVRASWTRDVIGDDLRPEVTRLVQSVTTVSDRALAITLHSRRVDGPAALAHPDLAIARSVAGSSWPLGTRSSRITLDSPPAARAASVLTVTHDARPAVRFLVGPGDPRDRLDEGVDLLITQDPAVLDYAATLPQFQSVPLAWQRTHVLLTPGRSRSSPSLSDDQRQILADDAVRGEARGAQGPFWWQMLPDCEVAPSPARNPFSPTPRIVYDASDGTSRDLAERFVGLVRATGPAAMAFLDALLPDRPRRTYQRATGLTGEPLALARRLGTDAGYVVALDSRPIDPCRDVRALMDGARWLDPETMVPLVETRPQALVRRGRSGLTAEWDGGVVLAGANGPR